MYKSSIYVLHSPRTQETDLENSVCPTWIILHALIVNECLLLICLYDVQSICTFLRRSFDFFFFLAEKQHHLAAIKAPSRLKKNTISN